MREQLAEQFRRVRERTVELCAPLTPEDCGVQSMADASPTKWHLAHTTWFFETFVLDPGLSGYQPLDPSYRALFNSYYNAVGEQHPRPRRGMLTRPSLAQVSAFRNHVDRGIDAFLSGAAEDAFRSYLPVIELGIQHEQQHQELILTDIKHAFSCNPLAPAYRPSGPDGAAPAGRGPNLPGAPEWASYGGGTVEIGHAGESFAFDNERPRHTQVVHPYALARRPVTCGEYLAFIEDGGYERPDLWLSDGWEQRQRDGWLAPLYWRREAGRWRIFTLSGQADLVPAEPVCHVSYYEADAFARWADARLPTEIEWEHAAKDAAGTGNFADSGRLHPRAADPGAEGSGKGNGGPLQLFGDVWEWTASAYLPYPGYRPQAGALGEYNGKFMVNQMVLRGGSCASPSSHLRPTYRNFFPPGARWQFSGIRLAR
jgi:ergothioneine biosynthesis protein EgtB